ncbi:hypothetical protein OPV22_002479 [Ensete ventricosum]|uniref:Uncharacterized protein n=1 Tax=Ensete ventricosum TaxID=4639 RepID=A0AAV8RY35_ENSVE|nr:hypothetical protein OPV22_002479 [Ensete ventricosum]
MRAASTAEARTDRSFEGIPSMRSRTRRAPSACPKGHVRDLGIGQWAPHPTRLETRTKESDMRASQRVRKPGRHKEADGREPSRGVAPPADPDLL